MNTAKDLNGVTRVLNFKRALHTYEAERYFKPPKLERVPDEDEIEEVSKIGRFDQLSFGSCTYNAMANLIDVRQTQKPGSPICFHPFYLPASRMFGYRMETELDGDPGQDNGSYLHTAAKVISTIGAVSEKVYPYVAESLQNTPPPYIMKWAAQHKLSNVAPVANDIGTILATLAAKNPIVYGMPVYREFMNLNSTDYILHGNSMFESPFGGHANMLYGFIKINGIYHWKDLNSWGAGWGQNGTCLIPSPLGLRYFSDLWTAW